MITFEGKDYHDVIELYTMMNRPKQYQCADIVELWIKIYGKIGPYAGYIENRLMALVNAKKIRRLECTKEKDERVYYYFNIEDITECLENIEAEELTKMKYGFSEMKVVEPEEESEPPESDPVEPPDDDIDDTLPEQDHPSGGDTNPDDGHNG